MPETRLPGRCSFGSCEFPRTCECAACRVLRACWPHSGTLLCFSLSLERMGAVAFRSRNFFSFDAMSRDMHAPCKSVSPANRESPASSCHTVTGKAAAARNSHTILGLARQAAPPPHLTPNPCFRISRVLLPCVLPPSSFSPLLHSFVRPSSLPHPSRRHILFASLHQQKLFTFSIAFASALVSIILFQLACPDLTTHYASCCSIGGTSLLSTPATPIQTVKKRR